MKLDINCYPCLLNMVLKISSLSEMSLVQSEKLMKEAISILHTIDPQKRNTPPHYAAILNKKAAEIKGVEYHEFDAYKTLKTKSNQEALELEKDMIEIIEDSSDKLSTALQISAIGNIIDFGAIDHKKIDIKNELLNVSNLKFERYDIQSFSQNISSAKNLLYIGDNSGEIVTDKILISQLKKLFPKIKIVFASRERPILNDVTLEDCYKIGMDKVCDVISSGSVHPGTIIEKTSDEFKILYDNADIIIAKGQGNYETLSESKNNKLFFIFRVKCEQVALCTNATHDSLILMQNKKET